MAVETSFGRWLQRRRKALDLTQEELAQRVGCSAEYLRKIEADFRRPSRQIAERLAKALEIPVPDQVVFIKAARAELAPDRLKSPTQDIPQVALVPAKTLSSEAVSFLLTQITPTYQTKPFDGRCPYKGLDVFEEEDAELFFGRERWVEDLIGRVKESRTVFIIGPSGGGKSSLVRAGLIPALRHGAIKNLQSERWLYETMKPGRNPIGQLAQVISGMAGTTSAGDEIRANASMEIGILRQWCEIALREGRNKRAVLFIDQFEEIFTQVSDEKERLIFLNLLTDATLAENGRVIVLFAMRSDFVMNCAPYPQLNALFNRQSMQIGAMAPHELVNAIARPALSVGLRIDEKLVEQIINDMQGEPGALPLMQFALKDLFDSQQEKGGAIDLTLIDYLQHGGIHKSLERHADDSFAKLQDDEQELARSIFSRLIAIGRGTEDTRRTALLDELVPANTSEADVQRVVRKLADARLITTDEQAGKDTVTISHEKLIDAWPWLKKLVNENRDAIALQNEIASDAKEWDDHQRDASYLYTGTRLASAHEKLSSTHIVLSGLAQLFIDRSAKTYAEEVEAEWQRTVQLRRRPVYLIAAFVAVVIAIFLGIRLQQQERFALVRKLEAQAIDLADHRLDTALLLSLEAGRLLPAEETNRNLLNVLEANLRLKFYVHPHQTEVRAIEFNSDGSRFASGSLDGTIGVWKSDNGEQIGNLFVGPVDSLAFSPNLQMVATGSSNGTIELWEVETGKRIHSFEHHRNSIQSVAFSPDGHLLAAGSRDNTISVWNVETGEPIFLSLRGHIEQVQSLAFSPDGKTLASGDAHSDIILWDLSNGETINDKMSDHTSWILALAFSPDGKTLASSSGDHTIILWDLQQFQPMTQLMGHTSFVHSLAFSPDGSVLASGGQDELLLLWDPKTGQRIDQPLRGHTRAVFSLAFHPDSQTLVSGGGDDTIIKWNLNGFTRLGTVLTENTTRMLSVAISPDGKTLAAADVEDGSIALWDLENQQQIEPLLVGHEDRVRGLAFSPNGKRLASASNDRTVRLWDVESHEEVAHLQGHIDNVITVAFSPDGKWLASGSRDKTIIIWSIETYQPIRHLEGGHTYSVMSVAFSPDGQMLASGGWDRTIWLWDLQTGTGTQMQMLPEQVSLVHSVAFDPAGQQLASGNFMGDIYLWDVVTHRSIGPPLSEHLSDVYRVVYHPKQRLLASGAGDGTVILWDLAIFQVMAQFQVGRKRVESVVFNSQDGRILAAGICDRTYPTGGCLEGKIVVWNLDPLTWQDPACQIVGRNLSQQEWKAYFENLPYHITCRQWPAGE